MPMLLATNWSALDGSTSAPTGDPQYPTFFSGLLGTTYATRPAWKVAGVDYRPGVNTGVVLKNPLSDSLPGSASVDNTNKLIRVNGNNTTFDGWDFATSGYGLYVNGTSANTTVLNSTFNGGTLNRTPILSDATAKTITVRYCEIDGGGANGTSVAELIRGGAATSPTMTVEYCWLKHAFADVLAPGSGSTSIVRYNLFDSHMYAAGGHADLLQTRSVTVQSVLMNFNTVYQPEADGVTGFPGSLNAFMIDTAPPGPISLIELGYNVYGGVGTTHATATGNNGNALNYFGFLGASLPGAVNLAFVHDNYLDPRSLNGIIYPTPGNGILSHIYSNNVKLTDGTQFTYPY